MTERIVIRFAPAEGAVLRLLGLVERRGFQVTAIGMTEHPNGSVATMMLDLVARDQSRALDVLGFQIRRLHGVYDLAPAFAGAQGRAA